MSRIVRTVCLIVWMVIPDQGTLSVGVIHPEAVFDEPGSVSAGDRRESLLLAYAPGGEFVDRMRFMFPAADACGVDIQWVEAHWPRLYQLINAGQVDGAVDVEKRTDASSMMVLPLIHTVPDVRRSIGVNRYHLYVHPEASLQEGELVIEGRRQLIAVERGRGTAEVARSMGFDVVSVTDLASMARMVGHRRVDGVLAEANRMDPVLKRVKIEAIDAIIKLEQPRLLRHRYLAFSLSYFAANRSLVDCLWSASNQPTGSRHSP